MQHRTISCLLYSAPCCIKVRQHNNQTVSARVPIGPVLQPYLLDILIRFHIHGFVFTTNESKIYRQVLVHEDDRDLQQILWCKNPVKRISIYRLNTVMYGTGPVSFLATKYLVVLTSQVESRHPAAAEVI